MTSGTIKAVLFYGNNQGAAKILIDKISTKLQFDESIILNCDDISLNDFKKFVSTKLLANNLFGGKKLIHKMPSTNMMIWEKEVKIFLS